MYYFWDNFFFPQITLDITMDSWLDPEILPTPFHPSSEEIWVGNMHEQTKSLAAVWLWNIAIPQWRDDINT